MDKKKKIFILIGILIIIGISFVIGIFIRKINVKKNNMAMNEAEKFEILFYDKQQTESYKIYTILDKSETERYDYNIYGCDGIVNIRIGGKECSLREALLEDKITMEEIIAKANKDLEEKNIIGDVYLDGGSKIYIYNGYTIIKCNTLDGNKDVYIGNKYMTINDLKI